MVDNPFFMAITNVYWVEEQGKKHMLISTLQFALKLQCHKMSMFYNYINMNRRGS